MREEMRAPDDAVAGGGNDRLASIDADKRNAKTLGESQLRCSHIPIARIEPRHACRRAPRRAVVARRQERRATVRLY